MEANSPVFVFSEGRSMFKNTREVAVRQTAELNKERVEKYLADEELMSEFRRWFDILAVGTDVTLKKLEIPESVQEHVQ